MNPVMLHFASGLSLFTGGCLLVALIVCKSFLVRIPVWAVDLLAVLALGLILLSGTPLPLTTLGLLVAIMLVWLVMIHLPARFTPMAKRFGVSGATALVVMMTAEGRYLATPRVEKAPQQFYVIGDSLSAGIGGAKWPEILQKRRGIEARNLAVAGATVASAMSQVERVEADGLLVVVEIGGNDLLGGTSAPEFAAGLENLLKKLDRHPIVMFELPLYPWAREFGYHQRRLANQYHAMLIPKRKLAWVLSGDEATEDGLHLSEVGAGRMADVVAKVLRLDEGR